MPYSDYIKQRTEAITNCLAELGCQPIIFAGAGLSRRYINGPSWIELLEAIVKFNPRIKDSIAFLYQKHSNLLDVGEQLVSDFHAWAWSEGKEHFDSALFSPSVHPDEFIKFFTAKYIGDITPPDLSAITKQELKKEIEQLQRIHPHSIITTNYDTLCETIYPKYTRIVGQKIIRAPGISVGEIFKIHGCVSDYKEIVLTKSDYENWTNKKKYLSAKLLTYFLEHPVLIIGYGAQDPNVLAILKDIDEILACPGSLVSNIFYLIYDDKLSHSSKPSDDLLLNLGNGSSMRVNALYAKDFLWVYKAFEANSSLDNVNPKTLRALMARTYELVRHDIPKMEIQVDFATLEQVVASDSILPKLLGITGLNNPDMFNATYPYTLTVVAKKLGYEIWHHAKELVRQIKKEKGIDINESDNKYHIKVKSGASEKSAVHKYSEAFVDLLRKVQQQLPYEIEKI
ncbi:MAG: SIR2-like domain-containing protein [Candidatus Electronema aureum]|uniref:SIR2-like domain-containing protein n=1 Tax=Candidatus Electronema aureum TaxID=2005002 RepID=A0A521G271_9BACT|nr:MAG: SIR2-like domain-containing protein [Candidatus Electronema aureum]